MKIPFLKPSSRTVDRPARHKGGAGPESQRVSVRGLFLALLLWVFVLALLYAGGTRRYSGLAAGQRAPATVVAAVDFTCEDLARTELNRRQAADTIPPVFSVNYGLHNTAIRSLDKLVERLAQLNQPSTPPRTAKDVDREISTVIDLLGLSLSAADAHKLAPPGREDEVLGVIKTALRETWAGGIVSAREKQTAYQGVAASGRITLHAPDGGFSGLLTLSKLPLPEEALASTVDKIALGLGGTTVPKNLLTSLLKPWIAPNLAYDPLATDEQRNGAARAVSPVAMKVRAGTAIVEAGERITSQILEQLRAHNERLAQIESPYDRFVERVGNAGLLVAVLIGCVGLLQIFSPDTLRRDSKILLLVALSVLSLLAAKGILQLSSTTRLIPSAAVRFALPLGLAPLLASILMGSGAAIPLGLWNSFAMAVLLDNDFTVFTLGVVVTVVAALSTRDVRRRPQIYRAGLVVGLAEVLYALSLASISQQSVSVVTSQVVAALMSGVLCALIASLLIPLFEMSLGITTNLTLLELSDMANPLLQRLAMEAPGTYHHSIVVANLGMPAATRIRANALLVRACAYFHDIGKLAKPEYFSENMHLKDNPHDDLAPSMSALLITTHVKEGVGLARRYKLPRSIADGIEQHHGTGLVSYFYHRARQQHEAEQANGGRTNGRSVREQDFRYAGPRPRSREMAILLLADAVEAAARSLEKPTPHRIRNLVDEIVESKLRDGQLDACNLTLAELSTIKESFVFTLANMLHVRIAYPQDETDLVHSTDQASATHAGDQAAGPAPAEAGAGAARPQPLE
ncbi:MAG: HDIG domain-containing metalloprotein [Verrucomicrobiota bacterium]